MEGELTKSENAAVKPYLVQLFEEGMEKGMEKGMETGIEKGKIEGKIEGMEQLLKQFILNNPELDDQKIAMLFSLPIEFVMETRARL
jgi:flagellar biosynthesis/type III secretory pathway protein FliH